MVPTYEAIEASYAFLAQRYGLSGALDEAGVRAALDMASELANTPEDVPAAIFYALSRYPKALGGAVRALPALLALNIARSSGRPVNVTARELSTLFVPIATRSMTFEQVRDWFDQHS